MIKLRLLLILFLLPVASLLTQAQKPFSEGQVIYKVVLTTADGKTFSGTYTFFIKGSQVRKEIKLNNGYQDIVLMDCAANKVYSLQNHNGKKLAIELSMSELLKKQQKFTGFTVKNEVTDEHKIAGHTAYRANISYTDGSSPEVYYTKEWNPTQTITFERFPNARFLPLHFSYTDEDGVMTFDAEKIEAGPVENSVFRIPPDYKMISYKEYKQLSQ